jgi:hypothetical protein
MANNNDANQTNKGKMTVEEAGQKGGKIGGPRVRDLVKKGEEVEQQQDNE